MSSKAFESDAICDLLVMGKLENTPFTSMIPEMPQHIRDESGEKKSKTEIQESEIQNRIGTTFRSKNIFKFY